MSCGCENRRLAQEYERMYRLAKGYARMEGVTVALYKRPDGTYEFARATDVRNKDNVELISPY